MFRYTKQASNFFKKNPNNHHISHHELTHEMTKSEKFNMIGLSYIHRQNFIFFYFAIVYKCQCDGEKFKGDLLFCNCSPNLFFLATDKSIIIHIKSPY